MFSTMLASSSALSLTASNSHRWESVAWLANLILIVLNIRLYFSTQDAVLDHRASHSLASTLRASSAYSLGTRLHDLLSAHQILSAALSAYKSATQDLMRMLRAVRADRRVVCTLAIKAVAEAAALRAANRGLTQECTHACRRRRIISSKTVELLRALGAASTNELACRDAAREAEMRCLRVENAALVTALEECGRRE
jgi:choline dehydrogenase-like flavoprotein